MFCGVASEKGELCQEFWGEGGGQDKALELQRAGRRALQGYTRVARSASGGHACVFVGARGRVWEGV